jgi:hypothetical protein
VSGDRFLVFTRLMAIDHQQQKVQMIECRLLMVQWQYASWVDRRRQLKYVAMSIDHLFNTII